MVLLDQRQLHKLGINSFQDLQQQLDFQELPNFYQQLDQGGFLKDCYLMDFQLV
jgi:hypothetical protein